MLCETQGASSSDVLVFVLASPFAIGILPFVLGEHGRAQCDDVGGRREGGNRVNEQMR